MGTPMSQDECGCLEGDHSVECIETALDLMVLKGEVEVDVVDGVKKYRLTPRGEMMAKLLSGRPIMDMN
jgi:hypothetical protein